MNLNLAWALCIVEALLQTGKATFFTSPGSRNSPLLAALNRLPNATSYEHVDERGLGFLALGHAKATDGISVLICTSGSAPSHFLPAIMEAFHSDLSLFVLSADRPPELTWNGSNQATDQLKIYGDFVHRFANLPTPSVEVDRKNLTNTIDWLAHECLLRGPVHANVPFREPLLGGSEKNKADAKTFLSKRAPLDPNPQPQTFETKSLCLDERSECRGLLDRLVESDRGLVLFGKTERPYKNPESITNLVRRLGLPVLADVGSFARALVPKELLLEGYPHWLDKVQLKPTIVLHLAGQFVYKGLADYMDRVSPQKTLAVHERFGRVDPAGVVSHAIRMPVEAFVADMLDGFFQSEPLPSPSKLAWLREWKFFEACYQACVSAGLGGAAEGDLNELQVAKVFVDWVDPKTLAFVGNSSPIREVDGLPWTGKTEGVFANRGLSGIDGLVATASGLAVAQQKPIWTLLGDLSLLHDMGSLPLFEGTPKGSCMVVVNNNEGSVFRRLPIFKHFAKNPSKLLHSHSKTFADLASFSGLHYHLVRSVSELQKILRWVRDNGTNARSMVEVAVDPVKNQEARQSFSRKVDSAFRIPLDRN